MHPENEDGCAKPEFDVKLENFSFYTRKQGRINSYFKFKPVDYAEWTEKMPAEQNKEENEFFSGNNQHFAVRFTLGQNDS